MDSCLGEGAWALLVGVVGVLGVVGVEGMQVVFTGEVSSKTTTGKLVLVGLFD